MPKVNIYDIQGKVTGERDLAASVFGVKVSPNIVHEVMVGLESNARRPWAHTKTRGNVRGGGKKPWKQKGTGRARQGSIRSPQWAGGGIVFGPLSERNYNKKINRKLKEKALLMTLTDKVQNERLVLVDGLGSKEGKTKAFVALLGKLPVKGKTAVIVPGRDEMMTRATKNLKKVNLMTTSSLGLLEILRADYLVLSPAAADKIEAAHKK